MLSKSAEMIWCGVLVLSALTLCSARPPQAFDQATQGAGGELERSLLDAPDDLAALRMQLLAQQLAEYNALAPLGPGAERLALSKRQQRYRQCYFNPISCFRK